MAAATMMDVPPMTSAPMPMPLPPAKPMTKEEEREAKKVSVELRQYPKTHPFAGTQYADNICAFSTERYTPQPLVIQGPGAGAAVTAAGIFADVIKVAKSC